MRHGTVPVPISQQLCTQVRAHPFKCLCAAAATMRITPERVEIIAESIINKKCNSRRFRASFGTSPYVCASTWNKLFDEKALPDHAQPKHILWALLFLKVYASEHILASMCACDEKTLRKWVWAMVEKMADLEVVSQECLSFSQDVILTFSMRTLSPI